MTPKPGDSAFPKDRLAEYRAKRTASQTPEPFGGGVQPGGNLFVVQKHHARNVHWDLRLELDGVLVSWAVPRGPSPNPADKRMAVHVEDHPLEYAEFEGVIPDGNYGAGPVILWDKGVWVPLEDPYEGMEKGKLLFDLRGFKLHGRWTLVKTRQSDNSWLFIKETDQWVDERGTDGLPDDSIYSGLLVDQVGRAEERQAEVEARVEALGGVRSTVDSSKIRPMLATSRAMPFTREGWIFEIKYDGYRIIAAKAAGEPILWSRNGNDLTETFPEIARAVRGLPYDNVIVDGEVVVHDAAGLPSFSRLQKRGRLQRRSDILRASVELPAHMYVFDLLTLGEFDLRGLPLVARKDVLREALPTVGPLRFSDHIPEAGEAMYEHAQKMRLEGIVAKKADSVYRSIRSKEWFKIRTVETGDFVVIGWTEPSGSRAGFGSLHLAQYEGKDLVYTGSVGTGFTQKQLGEYQEMLEEIEIKTCPIAGGGAYAKKERHHWVSPELVAEVQYKEFTDAGQLRHPAFVAFRDDKRPEECILERVEELTEPVLIEDGTVDKDVPFTNLDKVFWPEEGYTQGDLIEYYRAISPWMLPYLLDRPLVMTRYPDGIDGKSFYQKDAPEWAPEWIRTETVYSEGSERDLDYFVADSPESLLYIANMGTIPMHVWHSRLDTLSQPDWCVLDLDPKEASFEDVIEVARAIRKVCEDIELPSYVKTSGSSGLHVMIPLGRQCTYEQSRVLGELMGRVITVELSEVATMARQISKREGKVYVDYLQNGHGKLIAAPFTVRPKPGAPVSMPLKWSEVKKGLTIEKHSIKTAPKRMKRMKTDPLAPVLEEKPDLVGALERLMGWFG